MTYYKIFGTFSDDTVIYDSGFTRKNGQTLDRVLETMRMMYDLFYPEFLNVFFYLTLTAVELENN